MVLDHHLHQNVGMAQQHAHALVGGRTTLDKLVKLEEALLQIRRLLQLISMIAQNRAHPCKQRDFDLVLTNRRQPLHADYRLACPAKQKRAVRCSEIRAFR